MVKPRAFYDMYRNVSAERREWLRSFRMEHPYHLMTWEGSEWGYIASGSGRDVVMVLGGATSTAESSFDLISVLEREFRVISVTYAAVSSVDQQIDGLMAMLDIAGVARTHLYGHSLGAGIAHVAVRSRPDRIDKVVLSSFGLPLPTEIQKLRRRLWLAERTPYALAKRRYRRSIEREYADADPDESAFMLAYTYDRFELQHTPASLRGRYRLMRDLVDNGDLYRVDEPIDRPDQVLICQAKDDAGFSAGAQDALRNTYPGAAVEVFPTGGHDLRRRNHEAYDEALLDFLRG